MAINIPTPDELAQIGEQILQNELDPTGTGAVNTRPGSRNSVAIAVNAGLYSRVAGFVADRVRARSVNDAIGDDLDVIANDLYQETRKPATFSAFPAFLLQRTNTAATYIPQGARFAVPAADSQPAIVFECSATMAVPASQTSVSIPISAIETGSQANVVASTISTILDQLPDNSWSVNVGSITGYTTGGDAVEQDTAFRRRLLSASPEDRRRAGTFAAVVAGALRVPGIAHVTAIEPGNGTIVLFCGDAGFQCGTDLQAAVALELQNWRCMGVPVVLRTFSVAYIGVTVTLYMNKSLANYDVTTIQADAKALIKDYFDKRERFDEYIQNAIESRCFEASPGNIQNVSVTLSPGQQTRLADASYAMSGSIGAYLVSDSTISIVVANPQTS